jgi:hypothetical protein
LWVALLVSVIAVAAGTAARKPAPCPDARYVIGGAPIIAGATSPDVVAIGSTISIGSGCSPVSVKRKTKKKGTTLKAVWKSGCTGVTGKVTLTGKIDAACGTVSGTVRGKKAKLKRAFTATRSSCGDGVRDAGAEACDAGSGCVKGQSCTNACACEGGGGPGTNQAPTAAASGPSTATAGTPVVYDGSGSTDPDGDALTHSWDFGDGIRAGGGQVAHVFNAAGTFTVRLTVGDGRGGTATSDVTVTVADGPAPGPEVMATGLVRTTGSDPIAGASVRIEPGGTTGTTDAMGNVTLGIRTGVPSQVHVSKAGFADQMIGLQAVTGSEDSVFEVTMLPRETPLLLADAAAGGTLDGKHGARVVIPANALVDTNGNAVTGAVDVSVSPLDVTEEPSAFPGRCEGVRTDGAQGLLVTHGTVEYALDQNGTPVNLRPGTAAVIEIPVYAALAKDGTPLALGDTSPLWSLDEQSGGWVEEGVGTIVQSAASPSGMALRGTVTHFSWWNHDAFEFPPARPKPRCLVDSNADGILEDLTGTGYCWHAGTGPEQPDDGFSLTGVHPAVTAPRIPQYTAQTTLPAAGGVELPIPADMDILFRSHAKGGTLRGQKLVRLGPNVSETVDIVLYPQDAPLLPIDPLPHSADYELTHDGRTFTFTATAGDRVWITLTRSDDFPFTLGGAFLIAPGDVELGTTTFGGNGDQIGQIGAALPSTGTYKINIGTMQAGDFHIEVTTGTGPFPFFVSTTPANGATGVAASTNLGVTFSQAVTSPVHFLLEGPSYNETFDLAIAGVSTAGPPSVPLAPGLTYRATVSTAFDAVTGKLQAPNPYEWTFMTAEEDGVPVPVFEANSTDTFLTIAVAIGAGGEGHAVWTTRFTQGSGGGQVFGDGYTAGEGWAAYQELSIPITGPAPNAAVTVDGQDVGTAIWTQREVGVQPFRHSISASRRQPGGTWSSPVLIETSSISFETEGVHVGADAAGNVIAVWNQESPLPKQLWWNRYTAGVGWGTAAVLTEGVTIGTLNERHRALVVSADGTALLTYKDPALHNHVRRFTPVGGWGTASDFGTGELRIAANASGDGMVYVQANASTRSTYRLFAAGAPGWCAAPPWCELPSMGIATTSSPSLALAPDGSAIVVLVVAGQGVVAVHYTPHPTNAAAGTWGAPVVLPTALEGADQLQMAMDATGDAVAIWKKSSDVAQPMRWTRYTAGGSWTAQQTVADIVQAVQIRLFMGAAGDTLVLSPSGQVLRAVRLP